MDAFADKMGAVGAWCGNNKYLSAIKNAFQNYMPATIAGAVGVLWSNVLVSADSGLGLFFKPIMILEPLNPVFNALNTATIGMITVGVTMLLAQEIADANGEQTGAYPAVLGFMMLMMITPTTMSVGGVAVSDAAGNALYKIDAATGEYLMENSQKVQMTLTDLIGMLAGQTYDGVDLSTISMASLSGIPNSYLGATGLFTGLIVGILGTELYCKLRHVDALKIKMPEQVPPGVARAFEILIPTCIILVIVGFVGWLSETLLGLDLNSLISTYVQTPLQQIIGGNIFAVCIMYVLIMLFWCVGIHGNNMVSGIKEAIFTPLMLENTMAFDSGISAYDVPNTFTMSSIQMFGEWGGSGVTLALIVAIFIFSKREDNRTIAAISVVPGIFNINETMTFGIPLVLNPMLDIPFILAPVICEIIGYILIIIGFCPKAVVQTPWTCPPVIFGFLATGGNPFGAFSQLIVMAAATAIYIPFFIAYEAQQNKDSANA